MAKCLMVQGTMSGVGKSLLVTALCRIFREDGWRVAPFKSQNMALNSAVTPDGLEIGRAQAVQAEAAGHLPDVRMNPILLKPSSDTGSQLIVNGKVRGQYRAREYFQMKRSLVPEILAAYQSLAAENDIIVIEGAGSPAEINLRKDDIVNMGLAEPLDAPVLLVGDIDPGGVFAQLCGTLWLLPKEERARVKGTIVNKFRGDRALFTEGVSMLEERTGLPCLGVVPFLNVQIDDEDSLSPLFARQMHDRPVDVAVIRLPHISNFTDFLPLTEHPVLGLRFVGDVEKLLRPDFIILPGTKNTIEDLRWLKEKGLAAEIVRLAKEGVPVLGICGGYQMLGEVVEDPEGLEFLGGGSEEGLGLLSVRTVLSGEKVLARTEAVALAGPFAGAKMEGYEIHNGRTEVLGEAFAKIVSRNGSLDNCINKYSYDGAQCGKVFGTYLHGLFDTGEMVNRLSEWLSKEKGCSDEAKRAAQALGSGRRTDFREKQYAELARVVRDNIDMDRIYEILGFDRGEAAKTCRNSMVPKNGLGLVHLYTGEGKGKTTAAVGLCLRAVGQGLRVVFVQFLKNGRSGELEPLRRLGVRILSGGAGTFVSKMSKEEREETQRRMDGLLREALDTPAELLVLDEACAAARLGMVDEELLKQAVERRSSGTEIVLTGRDPLPWMREAAAYVTVMEAEKHPYTEGIRARRGIEF